MGLPAPEDMLPLAKRHHEHVVPSQFRDSIVLPLVKKPAASARPG
jgi:hypothetical protein